MKSYIKDNSIIFDEADNLNLSLTLDCGQAFRWIQKPNGAWHAVVSGRAVDITQDGERITVIGDTDERFWRTYLDLDRDYGAICEKLKTDRWLNRAIKEYSGIRILRQDTWEALCSFIISQNNNIPRIKGIIERLCTAFGDDLGNGDFGFPSAERLAKCSVDDLAPLRSGFRAKYIIDAAQKVANGEVNLDSCFTLDYEDARACFTAAEELRLSLLTYGLNASWRSFIPRVYPNALLALRESLNNSSSTGGETRKQYKLTYNGRQYERAIKVFAALYQGKYPCTAVQDA